MTKVSNNTSDEPEFYYKIEIHISINE